jgi:hypothetical protein
MRRRQLLPPARIRNPHVLLRLNPPLCL